MKTSILSRSCFPGICLIALGALGCEPEAPAKKTKAAEPTTAAAASKKVPAGKNVFVEIEGQHRRVLINAYVCLREGMLEQLLCRRNTKEHEAILAAAVDARDIHKALIITGAEPGSVVKYLPKFQPPRGTTIKISLQYQENGKTVTVPAQKWVRDGKTKKDLAYDWVFAGSQLFPDPFDKKEPPVYAANSGDVICVSNFDSALLDLPINSSKDNEELAFEANTPRIPPLGTPVVVILEPVRAARPK